MRGLFAFSAGMLGYCAFTIADTWIFQKQQRHKLERVFEKQPMAAPGSLVSSLPASGDGMIGLVEIPSLGLSAMVMEGTSPHTLRHAAGHISGTALPGKPGNIGISAHRDTLFRPLRNVRRDDIVTFTTKEGAYRYRVVSTKVVDPHDMAVLDPGRTEVLTLITCYPFYFVGAAPSRFVVRAERVT
jgi:sortase A